MEFSDWLSIGRDTPRSRCLNQCITSVFCRSETIFKVGNTNIMSTRSPFSAYPLFPSFSFIFHVVLRLIGVRNLRFSIDRSGENGQISRTTFSKIQLDIARNCCQMVENGRMSADEEPSDPFLVIKGRLMLTSNWIFEWWRCLNRHVLSAFFHVQKLSKVCYVKVMSTLSPFERNNRQT